MTSGKEIPLCSSSIIILVIYQIGKIFNCHRSSTFSFCYPLPSYTESQPSEKHKNVLAVCHVVSNNTQRNRLWFRWSFGFMHVFYSGMYWYLVIGPMISLYCILNCERVIFYKIY
jgi:hypothetical protein